MISSLRSISMSRKADDASLREAEVIPFVTSPNRVASAKSAHLQALHFSAILWVGSQFQPPMRRPSDSTRRRFYQRGERVRKSLGNWRPRADSCSAQCDELIRYAVSRLGTT